MQRMHRFARFVLALAVALSPCAAAAQTAPSAPQIARPSVVAPNGIGSVQPPFLFQWTPVTPGNVFVVTIQNGKRVSTATNLGNASYELQISDAADVNSSILLDVVVTSPSYLFLNRYPDPAFTARQRNPLGGGRYYYRVRALFGQYASDYSTITPFVLTGGGATTTPNHQMSLFAVGVAGALSVGNASQIYAVAGNVGTYNENSGSVKILANGTNLGTVLLPPLAPGQRATITVPFVPRTSGQLQVVAQLNFTDQNPNGKAATLSASVGERRTVTGAIAGTIRLDGGGGWYLEDPQRRRVAALVDGRITRAELPAFRDLPVFVSGRLVTASTGFRFEIDSVVKATPSAIP
jgi:hypothetical protein